MAPTAGDTTEAYKTAPLGNNSALTNIELSGFIVAAGNDTTTTGNNQFTKISDAN